VNHMAKGDTQFFFVAKQTVRFEVLTFVTELRSSFLGCDAM